jgi:hypothetical protein
MVNGMVVLIVGIAIVIGMVVLGAHIVDGMVGGVG